MVTFSSLGVSLVVYVIGEHEQSRLINLIFWLLLLLCPLLNPVECLEEPCPKNQLQKGIQRCSYPRNFPSCTRCNWFNFGIHSDAGQFEIFEIYITGVGVMSG